MRREAGEFTAKTALQTVSLDQIALEVEVGIGRLKRVLSEFWVWLGFQSFPLKAIS
jgi:hypothetical protein